MKNLQILTVVLIWLGGNVSFGQTSGPAGVRTSTNNIFWLRSDKGVTFDGSNNVTTWTDQSNSNDATNAITATNPAYDNSASIGSNNEGGILFTGSSSELLSITDNASINTSSVTARTIFIIFQTGSDVTTQQYLYQQGNATDGIFFYIQSGQLTAGIYSSSTLDNISTAASSIVASTAYVVAFTYDGGSGTLDLMLDGTSSTQVTSVSASIASHNNINLGSDTAPANYYTGHVAEMIYYDVVLNDGEHRMLNNYFSEKYGITTSNDHYATAGASYRYELTGISSVNSEEHNTSQGLGGTLYLSENPSDQLSTNEHIMAGHNNDNLSNTASDMSLVSGSDRYNRIWYIEKTGNLGARIEFDVVEAGLATPTDANDYQLIRRTGTSGDFSEVTATKSLNTNRVRFDVTDGNFSSGYFSLGNPSTAKKWYAINSGNWNDANNWTLDPAGVTYNNPESLTPRTSPSAASDEVTIGSGKTITLSDGDISSTLTKLTVDGTLDFASSSGHSTISELVGSGTIRSSGDDGSTPRTVNFPTITDASNFVSAGTGAGTIEFYGSEDIDVTSSATVTTFYNLVVNLTLVSDDELSIETDIVINGNLTITSGNFQINDATNGSANIRNITVSGNVTVAASGEISTGTGNTLSDLSNLPSKVVPVDETNYYSAFHQFTIQGDFTNNGTVNFSNETVPGFKSLTTTGATTVRFTGASDNTATFNGETNFYNIQIAKGSDRTYTMIFNATANDDFRLFGRNDYQTTNLETSSDPSDCGKALWIQSGTLELQGNLKIASLTEGLTDDTSIFSSTGVGNSRKQFFVPESGKLRINGSNVEVYISADDETEVDNLWGTSGTAASDLNKTTNGTKGFINSGHLLIDNGTIGFNNGLALQYITNAEPIFEFNGGTTNLPQFRPNTTASSGSPAFILTGGTINVEGTTDGSLVQDNQAVFSIPTTSGVFRMSGGTINISDVREGETNPNGIYILSSQGNYDVTGGSITINIASGQTNATDPFEISSTANFNNLTITNDDDDAIEVLTDLVLSGDLILNGTNTSALDMNGNNLTIGRNFNIETNATYTQGGNNTTTFNGNSDQVITLAGTYGNFYDVTCSGSDTKTLVSGDMTITNTLTINSGATLNDGGQTIFIQNMVNNSGIHESATGGEVEFTGGSATYTVGGDGTGVFGNVILDDATNDVTFSASQAVTGTLTFSQNQLLDIDIYGLTMQGANAVFSGNSGSRYVQMAGNASDGGLSMYLDANETLTYPIGTDANATVRYTPVDATFTSFSDDGYVKISISDSDLQTTNLNGDNLLTYYWRVAHSDFTTEPTVQYDFTYANSDTHTGSQLVTGDNYEAGKVLDVSPYTRSSEGTIINASNTITFDGAGSGFTLENANYTAGDNDDLGSGGRFDGAPEVYYSRAIDGTWWEWQTTNNWSVDAVNQHLGAAASDYPQSGDVAIVGSVYVDAIGCDPCTQNGVGRHQVRIDNSVGDVTIAELIFDSQPGGTALNSTDMSRVRVRGNRTLTVGRILGKGEMVLDVGTPVQTGTIVADDAAFVAEPNNGWFFWFQNASGVTISDRFDYPIFRTFGANGTLSFTQDVTATGILIDSDTDLQITTNFDVSGDILIGSNSSGNLTFMDVGSNLTFECEDIIFSDDANNTLSVENSGTDVHTLILNGDVTLDQGSTFDLTSASSNVILSLQSTGTHSFTNPNGITTDLYQVVMNKGTDQTSSFTFNDDFTISTPTASLQPIVLQNGTLVINDAAIGAADDLILTNATNNTDFDIPGTAALQISAGKAVVLGTDIGITLDGLLQIDGTGELDMDGGSNNHIEYSGSGNAAITIGGSGILTVGSQIRPNSVSSGGVLSYTQSGGTVTLGTVTTGSPATNRSMLEITGTGSSFTFSGGTLTIANDLSTTAVPTLYLDPASSSVSAGSTLQFGNASTAATFNDMSIQSTIELYDFIIDNSAGANYPAVTILNAALGIANDLTIEANTSLDASGLGLTIGGDFSNTSGASGFTANSNTTIFDGSATQIITGNGTMFYNITKNASNTLQLASGTDITVSNDLRIESGTLDDNDNDISVSGILHNAATHTNNSGSATNNGIILAGSNTQSITGAGTFSRIRINNTSGATTAANISITEQVILNGGNLDIQGNQLSMDDDAVFVDGTGSGFSATNMIQTRRSFTDAGVIKTYATGDTPAFTYPIGSGSKYTPVVVDLSANSATGNTIAVRASDEPHPNVQENVDVPEFVDTDNVLQYYWEVSSAGIGGNSVSGSIVFTYTGTDAYVTSPFTLDDYFVARLLPDDSDLWNKESTGFKYQAADSENTLTFNLSSVSDDQIGGDYTAGIDDAVPDQVQTINSIVSSGNWSAGSSWSGGVAPAGVIVVIDAGEVITMDVNAQNVYRTQIDGELLLGSTTNHRLGEVSGTGTLRVESGSLPSGTYDNFFNCSTGGSVDFGGTGSYTLPSEIASIRNLEISDGGTKSLPNVDVVICGNLVLDDGASLTNPQNRTVTIQGNLVLTNGTINFGTGANITVQGNCTITNGTMNIADNNITVNGSLSLNGGTLNLGAGGTLDVDSDFTLGGGTLNGANTSNLNIGGNLTLSSGTFAVDATSTTITLDGTGAQNVAGDFTGTSAFNNLTLNKSSGSATIVDGGNNDVEIDGVLTLTLGTITTDASNTMTITSTGSISGGNSSSYVNGPLSKLGLGVGDNFTFEIGAGNDYAFTRIENVGTAGQTWSASYTSSNANSGQTIDTSTNPSYGEMTKISGRTSWTITSSGSNTATVVLGIQTHMSVLDLSDIRVAIYDGPTANQWVNLGGTTTGTTSDGSVTAQSSASFSAKEFSLGGVGESSLPVDWLSFDAQLNEEGIVLLDWSTATETNNEYFEIERSTSGEVFESIGTMDGQGTTTEISTYQFTDLDPLVGTSFYRLKQVDYDGQFSYSATRRLDYDPLDKLIRVYPNPLEGGYLHLLVKGLAQEQKLNLVIFDINGRAIDHRILTADYNGSIETELNTAFQKGIYIVKISAGDRIETTKLVVK